MRNEKRYAVTLGFALVCVIMLASCPAAFDSSNNQTPVETGYGRVRISLTGGGTASETTRTVLPPAAFSQYVYTFTKAGGTPEALIPENGYFTLEFGDYTVKVDAYIGTTSPVLVASGVSPVFSVGPGTNDAAVLVPLSGLAAAGQGTFSYSVEYPVGASAQITLEEWSGSSITLTPVTSGNVISEELTLNAGSYLLKVHVDKNGLYAGVSESVHIYPELETAYKKEFSDGDLLGDKMVVRNSAQWNTALNRIAAGGNGTAASPKEYTITVDNKENPILIEGSAASTFDAANITVTLTGSGTLQLDGTGSILYIGADQTVIIDSENLILQGHGDNTTSLVYVSGSTAKLEMKDGTITGNTSTYFGGGVIVNNGTLAMGGNASVSGNTAVNAGGVYVMNGVFTMQGSASVYNNTTGGAGAGGGVRFDNGTFTMQDNASVSGNKATGHFGGGVSVGVGTFIMKDNASVSGNDGGGVNISGGNFTMQDSASVSGNTTSYGGGIYIGNNGNFTMQGSASVYDNTSTGSGGGVYVYSGTFIMQGGTVYGSDAAIGLRNTANGDGDALYNGGGDAQYGDGTDILPHTDGQANYTNNTITGREMVKLPVANTNEWNTALSTIQNGGSNQGYTIEVSGNVSVSDITIITGSSNSFGANTNIAVTINGSGKLYLDSQGSIIRLGNGQSLYLDGITLEGLTDGQNGSIQDNNAPVVYIGGGTFTMLNDAAISGNTYNGNGGGVFIANGAFTMQDDAKISGNSSFFGGGVWVDEGTFTMLGDAIVSGNNATYGGGVVVYGGTFTMRDSAAVSGNTYSSSGITGSGGGVYVDDSGIFTMEGNATVSENSSSGSGGGVYVGSGTFTMQDGTIHGNTALSGGGVYVIDAGFIMTGGTISGNTAECDDDDNGISIGGYGGGVYLVNGSSSLINFSKTGDSIIYGNDGSANQNTAILFVSGSSYGHAVFWVDQSAASIVRYRDTTLGEGDNISTEDTTTNWSIP